MSQITNKQAKQEAIRESYGEYYKELKDFINNDGWITTKGLYEKYYNKFDDIDFSNSLGNFYWRPISLNNLEENNGWTRIEPDGSNLPKNDGVYKAIWDDGALSDKLNFNQTVKHVWIRRITHFKPIEEEKPPIW